VPTRIKLQMRERPLDPYNNIHVNAYAAEAESKLVYATAQPAERQVPIHTAYYSEPHVIPYIHAPLIEEARRGSFIIRVLASGIRKYYRPKPLAFGRTDAFLTLTLPLGRSPFSPTSSSSSKLVLLTPPSAPSLSSAKSPSSNWLCSIS
jgi:hypothetical protein